MILFVLCCLPPYRAATLTSMMGKLKLGLVLLAVAVLGVALGWVLTGQLSPSSASPVERDAAGQNTVVVPPSRRGYCCAIVGKECADVASPVACFRAGGKAFNTDLTLCSAYCTRVR